MFQGSSLGLVAEQSRFTPIPQLGFYQGPTLIHLHKVLSVTDARLLGSAHVLAVRPEHVGCLLYLVTPSSFLSSFLS
jgi:hypothetical protein